MQAGKSVALMDVKKWRGAYLSRGCILSKALMACSAICTCTQEAEEFGIEAEKLGFDYAHMVNKVGFWLEYVKV